MLCYAKFGDAKNKENTEYLSLYQDKTPDECIHSLECSWARFSELTITHGLNSEDSWRLSRWAGDIQVKVLGADRNQIYTINQITKKLDEYFPWDIILSDQKVNFFIVFSDTIKQDFSQRDYNFWKSIFGEKISHIEHAMNMNSSSNSHCVQSTMHNSQHQKIVSVLFVERAPDKIEACLQRGFKSALTSSYSGDPEQFYNRSKKLNKLDLFLLALLYDPHFQNNMPLKQVRQNFEQAYIDTLNRFRSALETEDSATFLKRGVD